MHKDRARIMVLGDCYEAMVAAAIFSTAGATLLTEREFSEEPDRAFGMFFFDGAFLRPARPKARPCQGFLRIRETEEELAQVGVPAVPQCLRGARGFVACRLLSPEGLERSDTERFRNAIREAERVCTRKVRSALQNKYGRFGNAPAYAAA